MNECFICMKSGHKAHECMREEKDYEIYDYYSDGDEDIMPIAKKGKSLPKKASPFQKRKRPSKKGKSRIKII